MLITGFHDVFENGWNLQNLFLSIAGILAAGMGISLLTGSFIPALIAAIVGLVLAISVAYGEGENLILGIKQILQGFVDFFVGVFTGDIERATKGIGEIFGGLKGVFDAVLNALEKMITSFFDWLDEKTGGKISGILDFVEGLLLAFVGLARDLLGGAIDGLQQMLEGLLMFLFGVFTGDWDKAWSGLVEIGKGAVNLLIGTVESFANFFVRAINAVIGALNRISVTVPDWDIFGDLAGKNFGFNIKKLNEISLPRLATGSVIPPNREFMAILGDNKQETEVVSPLSTMKQALLEALQESGGIGGDIRVELYLDGKKLAANQVKHINNMTRAAGKSVLLV